MDSTQLLYYEPKSAHESFIDIWSTKTMASVPNNERHVSEVNAKHLLYRFDFNDPWKYFSDGAPVASSVERGRKKSSKHKKIYISKQKKTFTARKNRAHRGIGKMCLLCSCKQDCLMRQPRETRLMIQQLRQRLFGKTTTSKTTCSHGKWRLKSAPVVSGGLRTIYHL